MCVVVAYLLQGLGLCLILEAKLLLFLQKKARKNVKDQNNLNHWAGYELTPDDAVLLKNKIAKLSTSLLKPVGMSPGIKVEGAFIFDLGGNVAEYSLDGSYDYSAYDYADPFEQNPVKSAYTGIRVVKE